MSYALGLTVIFGVGIGTYIMRSVFIVALANRTLPPILSIALGQVPAAVLAALVVSLAADPETGGLLGAEAAAIVVAGLVGYKTKNLFFTLVAGMATLFAVTGLS